MRRPSYILPIVLFAVAACNFFDREVNLEIPDHTPRIVVNAILEAGSEEIRMAVTRSIGMLDSSSFSRPLQDPVILVTINGQNYAGFSLDTAGHYVLPASIRTGDRIDMEVSAANIAPVFSETVVPAPPVIQDIRIGGSVYDFGGWEKREISFTLRDIPGEQNYYKVSFIQEREGDTSFWGIRSIGIDSPIPWLNYVYGGLAFTDVVFTDGEVTVTIWVDEYHLSRITDQTTNYLQVETVDKANYDYQTSFYTHFSNQQPDLFGGEPIPVANNIHGGFGLFASTAMVKVKLSED